MSEPEHSLVGGIVREGLAQQHGFVAELYQQIAQVVRNVVIKHEPHDEGGDICLTTSKSISPRWSS